MFSDLLIRLRSLFRRTAVEVELDEELRFHLENQVEKYIQSGLTREEATRRTRLDFGGVDQIKEDCREARGVSLVETLAQDLRFGLRILRKSPGFSAVAVVTLALAIGANAVVFSILNALVLRPVNVPQGQNLYMIERGKDRAPSNSYLDYLDLRDRNRSFNGLIAYEMAPAGLDINGNPSSIWLYEASGNYFDELGIQPYLGRFFHSSDEHGPDSAPYIVLSYAYWKSHFQGDRSVAGRVVRLNKYSYTILGVAPPQFRGTELFFAPDLWAPLVNEPQIEGGSDLDSRGARGMWLVGHLRSSVTPKQATEDLNSIAASLAKAYPKEDEGISFALARPGLLGDMLGGPVHAFIAGMMLLTGLILSAACANLGGLFSARAADRSRELALRLALGSSRRRILRQLLIEASLVSMAGGALGLVGCVPLLHWLNAWQPIPNIPINVTVDPDTRTYMVALLLALVSGLLFGIVPVRQVLKTDPYQGMKAYATGLAGSPRRLTLRDLLLGGQIAICGVLVTSSLVAVRGMVRSLHSSFGFVPQNAMQVNADLYMAGYRDEHVAVMQRRMLDAVQKIPGVTAAAYASRVPLNLGWSNSTVFSDSTTDYKLANALAEPMDYGVSPGYFEAAKTTVLMGRTFTWHDNENAPGVAVVNQEFARKVFGSEAKAIGSFFKIWGGKRVQVVGVVEDGKYKTLSEDRQPAMFLPILQSGRVDIWLIVRSNRGPQDLGPALASTLHGLDPGLPFTIDTWEKELSTALFAARAASMALGVLGGLGAMLAITGIFGMAAYSVSKRLRELGIRIAMGAQRKQVLLAALGRVFRLLAFGSTTGLILGLAATRLLSFIVYQATPRDPVVLGGVILAMLLVGLVAAWVPAQRALGADPLILLREE
jgi:macrolide transport system ATP-binding/permease protein